MLFHLINEKKWDLVKLSNILKTCSTRTQCVKIWSCYILLCILIDFISWFHKNLFVCLVLSFTRTALFVSGSETSLTVITLVKNASHMEAEYKCVSACVSWKCNWISLIDYNINFKKHCARSGELQTDLKHYNCCVGSGKRALIFRYLK